MSFDDAVRFANEGSHDKALEIFKAIEVNYTSNDKFYHCYANSLRETSKYEKSKEMYRKAIDLSQRTNFVYRNSRK